MKQLVKFILLLPLLLLVGIFSLALLLVDSEPLIYQQHQISASHADNSKRLAKRIADTWRNGEQQTKLVLTQAEINGLTALFHRAVPNSALNITLSEHGAVLLGSVGLPKPLNQQFVNISATLLPSETGLELAGVQVGGLSLSGTNTIRLTRWLVDYYVGKGATNKLLNTVTQVAISPNQLVVGLNVDKEVLALRQDASLLAKVRDELALFGDKAMITMYYQELLTFANHQPINGKVHQYINHIFNYANAQNQLALPASYIEQNKALLVALVLYFGDDRMALLVGDIAQLDWRQRVRQARHRQVITLAGRGDLQQHFIYSVALQLLSNDQASDALGEFKEFLDTNQGGSGFSFADLMADRAGTRLAMMATYSEAQAQQLQTVLAKVGDEELLPTIQGLAEGLDEQGFSKEYQGVSSSNYQQMLIHIDSRLKTLSLYQYHWR
ncbi:hypothetical protein [Thalassotalea euphylliae]|uniref:hypothetical protein n=1 Tax=Thalassotalea euphylliae TaxID=1655234 RepID=UPI0011C05099|nr:hypothetical protein [Thalassotalea euphylliae]